jgi:hypothetical protein
MLDDFTLAMFAPRLGESFHADDGSRVTELELVEANQATLSTGEPATGAGARVPFAIVFRGPLEPILPQRIYRFEHDALGEFDLFIVPIARDENGTQYEAVLS